MGRPRVVRSVEEQKTLDELRRERRRQTQRRRRESRTDQEREAEAKRRRMIRQADAQQRRVDNAARMRRYHAVRKDKEFTGAHSTFKRDFLDRHFGVSYVSPETPKRYYIEVLMSLLEV